MWKNIRSLHRHNAKEWAVEQVYGISVSLYMYMNVLLLFDSMRKTERIRIYI